MHTETTSSSEPFVLRHLLRISATFRRRRLVRFLSAFPITSDTRILDVGGGGHDWDWGEWSGAIPHLTVLNLTVEDGEADGVRYVRGNACDMEQFVDQSFDIAFSNSVIEHVGSFDNQQRMAAEIRRVARDYWVQTPNRHFPIEPHMCFPFFQYLPLSWRRVIGRYWPFSFEMLRRGNPERDAVEVRLLDRAEVERCFPEARVVPEKAFGLTKSWIATTAVPEPQTAP